jgi:hypothetical protein
MSVLTLILLLQDVDQVRNNANDALSSMQSLGTTSARNRNLLLTNLEAGFCDAASDIDYNQTISQLIQQLIDIGDFRQEDNSELQSGWNTVGDASIDVDNYTEDIEKDVADWPKFVFPVLFGAWFELRECIHLFISQSPIFTHVAFVILNSTRIIFCSGSLCFFLSIGVMLAWRGKDVGKYQCFLSWFILPMFTALIVASFILAAFIGIGASANAGKKVNVYFICCLMDAMLTELIAGCCLFSLVCIDFCSGGEIYSPDGTFNEILKLNGYSEDDIVYRIFSFYVDVSAVGLVIIV